MSTGSEIAANVAEREVAARLLAIAYHEAGHAVVARRFGRALGRVWLEVEHFEGKSVVAAGDDERQDVIIALAGGRAQARHDPSDRYSLQANGIPCDASDVARAVETIDRRMTRHFPIDDDDQRSLRFFRRWRRVTDRLVGSGPIWAAVDALAIALRDGGWTITGSAATSMVDRHLSR